MLWNKESFMAENVNFSKKMAKEIKVDELKVKDGQNELSAAKKDELNTIFAGDDKKISTEELAESLDKIDLNRDGTLTDDEMDKAYNKLTEQQKQNVKKTEYIAYLKEMSAKNNALVQNENNVGNAYVVQLGEQFDDLIIRIMKSNGVADDKCKSGTEEFKQYVARFKKDNAGTFTTNSDGSVRWLYASAKVYLNTDTTGSDKRTKNQDNKSQVENEYRAWVSGGKKGFVYEVGEDGKRYKVQGGKKIEITSGSKSATAYSVKLTGTKDEQISQLKVRTTNATEKGWYYSNDEKTHYKWDEAKGQFVKYAGVSYVDKNGTLTYGDKNIKLRETSASKDGWYFDSSLDAEIAQNSDVRAKGHYKYDESKGVFVNVQGILQVNDDGTVVVKHDEGTIIVNLTEDFKYTYNGKEYQLATSTEISDNKDSKPKTEEKPITKDVLNNRASASAGKAIATTLYDYADEYSGNTSVEKIRDYAKKAVDKDNVVEVWESAKEGGGVQNDDASLIATMTSEDISNGENSGRTMAVETSKHIMEKLIERAKEVGVKEAFISDLQYWCDYDYSGWVNDKRVLPGNLSCDDDDLGDLLEPKIDALIKKIKENEESLKKSNKVSSEFIDEDAKDFARTLYNYADEFNGPDSLPLIAKQVQTNVNKDNVTKIWKAAREGGGVQTVDASLIATMTSEMIGGQEENIINTTLHIMKKLVEKAKELGLEEAVYYDVQEAIKHDYSGWNSLEGQGIPGVFIEDADDLGDWLEPKIDNLVEAIEEAEAKQAKKK